MKNLMKIAGALALLSTPSFAEPVSTAYLENDNLKVQIIDFVKPYPGMPTAREGFPLSVIHSMTSEPPTTENLRKWIRRWRGDDEERAKLRMPWSAIKVRDGIRVIGDPLGRVDGNRWIPDEDGDSRLTQALAANVGVSKEVIEGLAE